LVIAAGVLMGLVSGVLLLFAALVIIRRSLYIVCLTLLTFYNLTLTVFITGENVGNISY